MGAHYIRHTVAFFLNFSDFIYVGSIHLCKEIVSLLPFKFACFPPPFYCVMALGRSSSTVLNSSGESGHPCPVPDFRGKAFRLPPISGFFINTLYRVEELS